MPLNQWVAGGRVHQHRERHCHRRRHPVRQTLPDTLTCSLATSSSFSGILPPSSLILVVLDRSTTCSSRVPARCLACIKETDSSTKTHANTPYRTQPETQVGFGKPLKLNAWLVQQQSFTGALCGDQPHPACNADFTPAALCYIADTTELHCPHTLTRSRSALSMAMSLSMPGRSGMEALEVWIERSNSKTCSSSTRICGKP